MMSRSMLTVYLPYGVHMVHLWLTLELIIDSTDYL